MGTLPSTTISVDHAIQESRGRHKTMSYMGSQESIVGRGHNGQENNSQIDCGTLAICHLVRLVIAKVSGRHLEIRGTREG